MKDYSQGGEQPHILRALEGVGPARFLDVGAFDPEVFSNTRALIEQGWTGVMVEPSPGPLRKLIESYNGNEAIRVLGAAVTVEGGIITMTMSNDALSSDNAQHVELWQRAAVPGQPPVFYGKMDALSISLKQLLDSYGGDFEFVNIDVEGSSVDLFVEMVRIGPRPRCVCVEHNGRLVELAAAYQGAGYSLAFLNDANVVLRWNGVRE